MFFANDNGSRQILGIGSFLGDLVFVDLATGAQPFVEALMQEARKRKFDMVVHMNEAGELAFGTAEMKKLFESLTDARSRDPQGQQGVRRAVPAVSPETSQTATQAQAVESVTGDGVAGALGKIERAVQEFEGLMFVLLPQMDRMLIPATLPSATARQLLERAGRLLALGRGNPNSQIVVFSQNDKLNSMKELLSTHDRGASPWHEVHPTHPDEGEIACFLTRAKCRHSLHGDVDATARLLAGRQHSLARIAEALRTQIHDGETDLSALVGSEYDKPRVLEIQSKLDALIGMDEIKEKLAVLVNMSRQQQAAIQRGEMLEPPSTHIALLGRPGTGKTIVARLIAELLHASGVRRRKTPPIEIGVKDIMSQYNQGDTIQKMNNHLRNAAGGVLFIDEAYGLASGDWAQGAVTTLVDEMEKRRGDLTVILAGYPDRMEELFRMNEGLRSRIPTDYIFHLRDYTSGEMCLISDSMISAKRVDITPTAQAKTHELIRREATRPHANGREVRNLVDSWDKARLARGGHGFELADIVDPRNVCATTAQGIIADFEKRYVEMKEAVAWMRRISMSAADSIRRGQLEPAPRMVFAGPPGTGKTETARIVGEFLHASGVLRHGRVREVSLQDFTSQYLGGAAERTREIFEECREGVLFIDEAYRLADDQQGRAVLDQIVAHLTDPEFSSVCVVLAGYTERMRTLMDTNPGLASRFPTHIRFEWPSPPALAEIARRHLENKHGLRPKIAESVQFMEALQRAIHSKRTSQNFAGARTAHNVADVVRANALAAGRAPGQCDVCDVPQDSPPPGMAATIASFRAEFIDQPELEELVKNLIASFVLRLREPQELALGIRLLGAPGTGKSTFARWLMKTFTQRGGAANAIVIEKSAQTLMGEFIGTAQANVDRMFKDACGGFIFIDEFHALAPQDVQSTSYGKSVIQQIVANMQMPANVRTTVVIAGYPDAMRHAVSSDDGLARRFPFEIEIPIPSVEALAQIAISRLKRSGSLEGIQDETISPALGSYFDERRRAEGRKFGNCGAAIALAESILRRALLRNDLMPGPVTFEDIVGELEA